MKKILSVLLSLAVVLTALGMLASCGAVTAASAIKKADEALTKAPYTMTMSMDFASDNAQLNTVFDAMSMEIPVTVDGNNMYMKMSMEVMPGVSASVKMTVFDKVLYYDMAVAGQTVKMKATMSDLEQKLMKLGEAIYAQQQAAQQAGAQPNAEAPKNNANDGDVVDAEVVDDK